jgi:Tfp pilus assembly protein FimT
MSRIQELRRQIAGASLVELILVLAVCAILAGIAAPAYRAVTDRTAVDAAANILEHALAKTRAAAVAEGGAAMVVKAPAGRFWIEYDDGSTADTAETAREYGVTVRCDGRDDGSVRVAYAGNGLGSFASHTITLSRGGEEAHISISTYGRVRRW